MKKSILLLLLLSMILAACSKPTTIEQSKNEEKTYVIKAGHAASRIILRKSHLKSLKRSLKVIARGKLRLKFIQKANLVEKEKCLNKCY